MARTFTQCPRCNDKFTEKNRLPTSWICKCGWSHSHVRSRLERVQADRTVYGLIFFGLAFVSIFFMWGFKKNNQATEAVAATAVEEIVQPPVRQAASVEPRLHKKKKMAESRKRKGSRVSHSKN